MAEKEFENDDPFELVQMYLDVPADDSFYDQMARTFIEEYMMMGWADEEIFALFQEPFYRGTHEILEKRGEAFVKNLIREVRSPSPQPSPLEGEGGRRPGEGEVNHG